MADPTKPPTSQRSEALRRLAAVSLATCDRASLALICRTLSPVIRPVAAGEVRT